MMLCYDNRKTATERGVDMEDHQKYHHETEKFDAGVFTKIRLNMNLDLSQTETLLELDTATELSYKAEQNCQQTMKAYNAYITFMQTEHAEDKWDPVICVQADKEFTTEGLQEMADHMRDEILDTLENDFSAAVESVSQIDESHSYGI